MASKYTPNYNLCQWEPEDQVLRTDFNADNAKIDAALAGMASSVGDKASTSALNNLKATVNQNTAALAEKGNCQLFTTTYVGDGAYGADSARSLSFPKQPVMAVVTSGTSRMLLFQDRTLTWTETTTAKVDVTVEWSGNTARWYSAKSAAAQMNAAKTTYTVVAFLKADQ